VNGRASVRALLVTFANSGQFGNGAHRAPTHGSMTDSWTGWCSKNDRAAR
jgi:hypothetical protein